MYLQDTHPRLKVLSRGDLDPSHGGVGPVILDGIEQSIK
jgi:hypothetical protein